MRIKLRKQFLDQWLCQVEALERLFPLQKVTEFVEAQLLLFFGGYVKALLCRRKLLRKQETNLLND